MFRSCVSKYCLDAERLALVERLCVADRFEVVVRVHSESVASGDAVLYSFAVTPYCNYPRNVHAQESGGNFRITISLLNGELILIWFYLNGAQILIQLWGLQKVNGSEESVVNTYQIKCLYFCTSRCNIGNISRWVTSIE